MTIATVFALLHGLSSLPRLYLDLAGVAAIALGIGFYGLGVLRAASRDRSSTQEHKQISESTKPTDTAHDGPWLAG